MKNIVKLILAAAVLFSAASCTKEYYTVGVSNEIITLRVNSSEWGVAYDADENVYYKATFPVPQITSRVLQEAVVSVYRVYRDDFGDVDSQCVLPSERHFQTYQFGVNPDGSLFHKVDENNNWLIDAKWTETIDYEFSDGSLTVYFTTNDFVIQTPDSMEFRVVITY